MFSGSMGSRERERAMTGALESAPDDRYGFWLGLLYPSRLTPENDSHGQEPNQDGGTIKPR